MFIELERVPPEGRDIECSVPTESLGAESDVRFVEPVRISARIVPLEHDRFRLSGGMDARVETDCVRCLEPFPMTLHEALDLLYAPQSANVGPEGREDQELELEEEDMGVSFYSGDRIDLKQMIWEQVYLALPMKPLCREGCLGLCQHCGTNLNLSKCGCAQDTVDPRLASLKTLLKP